MRVKLILPALTEATSPFFRPVKYALFPPLGLATLAGYLRDDDEVVLEDEHVHDLDLEDEPDLVGIEVYVTSARRAYAIADRYRARGVHVALGGLHVTALPGEAAAHADTVFVGPGEDTWPRFLADFRAGRPAPIYRSTVRTLEHLPPVRRDLIRREMYLVPNSIVVSRGCPHSCDFCYKDAFFAGGRSFYVQEVDSALSEIERLPGRHLYFLDDHLFGHPRFAASLFDGMRGMGRLWQAAGTVDSVLRPGLLEKAVACGLRSLFVGFETLDPAGLRAQGKRQNLGRDYAAAVRRLHDLGVMVNASFVYGLDEDGPDVFDRTVEWAVTHGLETATFHVLTPYPGTALFRRMESQGRLRHRDWDLYDTRHAVFQPARMSTDELERGYWRAYRDFYRYRSILRGAFTKPTLTGALRHAAYAISWKKCEPVWDLLIRTRRVARARPLLETVLKKTVPGGPRHRARTSRDVVVRDAGNTGAAVGPLTQPEDDRWTISLQSNTAMAYPRAEDGGSDATNLAGAGPAHPGGASGRPRNHPGGGRRGPGGPPAPAHPASHALRGACRLVPRRPPDPLPVEDVRRRIRDRRRERPAQAAHGKLSPRRLHAGAVPRERARPALGRPDLRSREPRMEPRARRALGARPRR